MTLVGYTFSRELATEAIERSYTPQDRLIERYEPLNPTPWGAGWGVRLDVDNLTADIALLSAELVIVVAQAKAISREEIDAMDATIAVRKMLKHAALDDGTVMYFPGYTLE